MTEIYDEQGYRPRATGPGRPALDPHWRDRVWTMHAQDKTLTARQLRTRLLGEPESPAHAPVPSERWVYRCLKEFNDLAPPDRQQYELARWPESFQEGALPWESAATVLALLQVLLPNRPSVRLARWVWRVRQAVPDAGLGPWLMSARQLAAAEVLGGIQGSDARGVEGWLAFHGWEDYVPEEAPPDEDDEDQDEVVTPEAAEAFRSLMQSKHRPLGPPTYKEAVAQGLIPRLDPPLNISSETPLEIVAEVLSEALGVSLDVAANMARYFVRASPFFAGGDVAMEREDAALLARSLLDAPFDWSEDITGQIHSVDEGEKAHE